MRYFVCDTLIDGFADAPIREARVLVENGAVTAVGPRADVDAPDDAERVDPPGEVVVPGFVDAHVHLQGARSMDPMDWVTESTALGTARATADLRSLLSAGFTAVRDVGSTTGLALRDAVQEGAIPGPRIHTSGQAISQTAGHGDAHFLPVEWVEDGDGISTLADGPAECRKEARRRFREGVDCLKIMTTGGVLSEKDAPDQSQFTDAEIRAMTEEAERVGVPVASHAQGAPGIKSALRNGVDTIEHGFNLDEESVDLFLETGATFVPTLAIMDRIVSRGADHGVPEYGLEKSRAAREAHFDAVRRAYEAGIPIAAGTDFIGPDLIPHGENALEMELLVEETGLSEMDAIRSATSVAGRTVADDAVGGLATGNHADMVALDADPLRDISAVRDVAAVYKGGERVSL
jgi:imidazolonepropionase-like amidohydrolase